MADVDTVSGGPGSTPASRRPTVVVDDLHVTYHVLVDSKDKRPAVPRWRRLLRRSIHHRTMRNVHALRGVSFTAYHGDIIGLVGSNGSGKSTLLRVIAGLTPATKGTVYADSHPTLLGVNAALVNELSGEKNILLGGLAMGLTKEEIESRVDEIAELAGIGDAIDLPMRTYSSGMGARLRFAIAASAAPDILLIDEALATGDAAFRHRSEQKIRELRDTASSVFIVSHALGDIEASCNRAIWIDQGQLRLDGGTDEVLKAYRDSVGA